jgi:ubiquinone/menaquinone biosynthesis C-methylase UbiE
VIGVEPLPLRVRIANKKQRDNLTFQVGDANDLSTFAAGSFDVVYLNAVFHWLPEKRGPLREFQRVLKQAGRLGISTGAKGRSGLRVIRKRVLSEAPFSRFVDAEHDIAHKVTEPELRGLLEESGFSVSSSELIEQVSHHATASAALDFAQASSFGNFWGSLPESLRSSAREALEAELEKTRAAEGIPLHGARLVVVAVKR